MSPISLKEALSRLQEDAEALLRTEAVPLGVADPPNGAGVYMFLVGGEIVYIGEAKGSQGLRDRLLRKHVSGDDNHACQREFKEQFLDRGLRREHIKANVYARWLEVFDPDHVAALERLLIWLYKPAWNRK